jgi:hypothetical protein
VEVRKVQPRAGASVYVSPGVFAVGEEPVPPAPAAEPGDAEEAEPPAPPAPVVVFEVGDVVGPLGGMLRRKKRYMAQHYGASEMDGVGTWSWQWRDGKRRANFKFKCNYRHCN